MAIDDAFNRTVAYYDAWIRKAVPGYEQLFSSALELIPFPVDADIDVLDLGAGTGLFSEKVLDRYPNGRFVLWDVAEKMLDVARQRFNDRRDRFRFLIGDYRDLGDAESRDLVISSLSIHHLSDEEKRDLFRNVFRALRRPGVFLNIDLIKGPTAYLEEFYCSNWYGKMRSAGASEEEVRAGIERRLSFDREALMNDQLLWLREAGFADADCVCRNFKMGLFVGLKR